MAIAHSAADKGYGRHDSRSIKTLAVADNLGGIALPHAKLAIRVHRRRQEASKPQTRETVYALTSRDAHQATPADLAAYLRGNLGRGKLQPSHSRCHVWRGHFHGPSGSAPRATRDLPKRALPFFGISYKPHPSGT